MSVTTAVVVPAEQAGHIDNIFKGLVTLGAVLAMSRDGIRDGIALREVFRKHTMDARELCLAAGVLIGEDWLEMVVVGGPLKGFIRAFPAARAAAVPIGNMLKFPRRKCEKEVARPVAAEVVPLRRC
jgi:hypothetical protein